MRLKECRENAGYSQKYVALELGISAPSVANWERGKTKPTRENVVRLADLYGVSVDYLLGRADADSATEPIQTDLSPSETNNSIRLTDDEKKLIRRYRTLDDESKEELLFRALELVRRSRDFASADDSPALIS